MFDHQAQGFCKSEDRVRRFAAGIRQILDREERAINVVMTVDEQQPHTIIVAEAGNVAQPSRFYLEGQKPNAHTTFACRNSRLSDGMTEEWIVRVQGKEYGPVDIETLREWKMEGRLLPANEARPIDVGLWTTAAEIPGLFESADVPVAPVASRLVKMPLQPRRSFGEILIETFRIYRKGFLRFLGLTLLIAVPSLCAQLTSFTLSPSPNMEMDFRTLAAAGFSFCMMLLSLAAWPLFIAGIQILTADLAAGHSVKMFSLLQNALKFWPRVAVLCILVYGAYFFWTVLPVGVILMISLAGPSVLFFFLALLVLAFQVWIVGRLFINFLFWQQFAVLERSDAGNALHQSKELARSRRNFPWFRRPMWRGVFIASIWFAFVFAINIGSEWHSIQHYLHELTTSQDPKAFIQALTTTSKPQALNLVGFSLGLAQTLLRPLLGIAFVLLYFESKIDIEP